LELKADLFKRSPFLLVFILIMLKMVLFRQFVFDGIQLDRLIVDAAAALSMLCVFELITTARWKGLVFGCYNLLLSLLLFASTIYFSYYGTVPTYTALHGLNQVGQIGDSIGDILQPSYYLFFADLLVLLVLYVVNRFRGVQVNRSKRVAKPLYVAIAALLCVTVSGGFIWKGSSIPNEVVMAESLGFLDYQVASAIKASELASALKDGNIKQTAAYTEELLGSYPYQDSSAAVAGTPNYFGVAKGKNVIVLQLEAFQNLGLNMIIDGQPVTPVLNELIGDSFYFPHFFQQIGQGNTSDAEFLSNTSIYPTGVIAMSTGYSDRELPSLPRLLAQDNYVSNTFHVNDVTFWDRNQMYPALGFTKYYDKPSFTSDNFNAFGASDEELYRVGIEKLKELQDEGQPFYAQFVTASSHHPFRVPADRQRITMPEGLAGTQLGNYLTALNYTDYAIGELIKGLKEQGIWDNTVLALYGDHFGMQTKDNDPAWVSEQLGIKYNDRISRFNIPFVLHVPGVEGKTLEHVGGQIDIMPTIANVLGISLKERNYTVFGQDLLNITNNLIGMRYYMPTGSFFNNDIMFVPGKGFEDGTAIDLRTMEPVADFSKYRRDYDYILELMKLSDRYVSQLPLR
jgi:lipoteichoic acid synthase